LIDVDRPRPDCTGHELLLQVPRQVTAFEKGGSHRTRGQTPRCWRLSLVSTGFCRHGAGSADFSPASGPPLAPQISDPRTTQRSPRLWGIWGPITARQGNHHPRGQRFPLRRNSRDTARSVAETSESRRARRGFPSGIGSADRSSQTEISFATSAAPPEVIHMKMRQEHVVDFRHGRRPSGRRHDAARKSRPPGLPVSINTVSSVGVTISVDPPPSESIQ